MSVDARPALGRDRWVPTVVVLVLDASRARYAPLLTGLAIGTAVVGLGCETVG